MTKSNISGRLTSLDALRGFDLFVLTALGPLMLSVVAAIGGENLNWLAQIFTHKDWEGFSPWDLVMPLFVFMSGASIPFALSKAKREGNVEIPAPSDQTCRTALALGYVRTGKFACIGSRAHISLH